MDRDTIFARADSLIEKQLPDELILVNGLTNELVSLSPSAEAIWKLIDGTRTVSEIVAAVCREFGTTPEQNPEERPAPEVFGEIVAADGSSVGEQVGSLIRIMAERGLVKPVPTGAAR
jgi:hypothetical protein